MKGSKTVSERLNLLNKIDKIIFVSKWTQNQFFKGIDRKLIHKTDVIYPVLIRKKFIKKIKILYLLENLMFLKVMIYIKKQF